MATSVKMRSTDKARLDRLQATLTGRSGRRISQEVLLARLLELGERSIDELAMGPPRMDERAIKRLLRLPVRTGVRTREEEIDAAIYGTEA